MWYLRGNTGACYAIKTVKGLLILTLKQPGWYVLLSVLLQKKIDHNIHTDMHWFNVPVWASHGSVQHCVTIKQNNKCVLSSWCSGEMLMASVAQFVTELLSVLRAITSVSGSRINVQSRLRSGGSHG